MVTTSSTDVNAFSLTSSAGLNLTCGSSLVDLEDGVDLARRLEDLLDLVGREGGEATAERVQLDEVEVLALGRDLRGGIQARMVHPLVDDAGGPLERAQMRDGVLGEDRQPETREELGDCMVDFGVVVVWTPGQHDSVRTGLFHPPQRFLALCPHVALELLILGPGGFDGLFDFRTGRKLGVLADDVLERIGQLEMQALLEMVFLIVGQPRVQERRGAGLAQLVDVQAQRLGVARDDGAVVMVAGTFVLLALPFGAGHPDEVGFLLDEVHDVAVAELGRVAHRFGRHGLDARLVRLLGRSIRQDDAEAQFGEEREPERVVLVHVERAWDAHCAARRIFGRERFVVEQAMRLVVEEVGHVGFLVVDTSALLAPVARDEAAVLAVRILAEVVDGEQAMVRAFLAAHRTMRGVECAELLECEQRRGHAFDRTVARK